MQTIQVQLEDSIYDDMLSRGIDVQVEFSKFIKKRIYKKEYKIANDIIKGLEEIKQGKTRPIKDLFSELSNTNKI